MFASPNDAIAYALRASQNRFHTFIDDLKPDEFERQPIPGANCVSWLLGHLALTDRRVLRLLGAELPPLPDGFEDKFKTTKQAAGEQEAFGDPAALVVAFDAHRRALIEAVERAEPGALNAPLPAPSAVAKTVGEFAAFMPVHVAMHAGQITLIRRCLGYPPVA